MTIATVKYDQVIVNGVGIKVVPEQCYYQFEHRCGHKGIGMESGSWPKCQASADCGFRQNTAVVKEIMRPRTQSEINVETLEREAARLNGVEIEPDTLEIEREFMRHSK